jgi:hypothetical protein
MIAVVDTMYLMTRQFFCLAFLQSLVLMTVVQKGRDYFAETGDKVKLQVLRQDLLGLA